MAPRIRQNYLEQSRRPLYCLLFLAPLIIGYEIGVWNDNRALLAEQMLRGFLAPRGSVSFLSGLFVLAVLIGWQIASGQSWTVRPAVLGVMFLEALALTLPLFVLYAILPARLSRPPGPAAAAMTNDECRMTKEVRSRNDEGLVGDRHSEFVILSSFDGRHSTFVSAAGGSQPAASEPRDPPPPREAAGERGRGGRLRDIAISLGAGPYEELIFRLFLVELLLWLMVGVLNVERQAAVITAVLISATLFAAYHYLPGTGERFNWGSFLFRTGAGIYFSIVFVVRGYGLAAGCHTFYDVLVDLAA